MKQNMKTPIRFFSFNFLLILLITACSTNNSSPQNILSSPTWVATQDAQNEYSKALKRWQSHNISNYEITVDIFSSMLAPPCFMKGIITVQNNTTVTVREIETPMPIQMSNGNVIYNPECHDYGNYLVTKQFEVVENLLTGQLPYRWSVKFDAEYGYITELTYTTSGESAKRVIYSN